MDSFFLLFFFFGVTLRLGSSALKSLVQRIKEKKWSNLLEERVCQLINATNSGAREDVVNNLRETQTSMGTLKDFQMSVNVVLFFLSPALEPNV